MGLPAGTTGRGNGRGICQSKLPDCANKGIAAAMMNNGSLRIMALLLQLNDFNLRQQTNGSSASFVGRNDEAECSVLSKHRLSICGIRQQVLSRSHVRVQFAYRKNHLIAIRSGSQDIACQRGSAKTRPQRDAGFLENVTEPDTFVGRLDAIVIGDRL